MIRTFGCRTSSEYLTANNEVSELVKVTEKERKISELQVENIQMFLVFCSWVAITLCSVGASDTGINLVNAALLENKSTGKWENKSSGR